MRAVALLAIVITAALTQSAQAVVLNEDADWDRTWQIAKWVSAAETEVRGLKLRLEFWEDDSAFNFKLAVTNTGDTACILRRPTQELFDFTVLRSDEVVWHYNRNRFFTQTPHTLTIDPGETQDYTATWDGKDCRGIPLKTWLGIDLEAQLQASDEPLRLRMVNVYPTAANWRLSAFTDVSRSHWAYDAFSSLQQMGVLRGYPDRWFSGDRTLTNYDMTQAISRLRDVMGNSDYDESVRTLASALEAEFANQLAEYHRVLVNYMGIAGIAESLGSEGGRTDHGIQNERTSERLRGAYDVVPTDHWAYEELSSLQLAGVLDGYPDQYFSGGRAVFVCEIAVALAHILDSCTYAEHGEEVRQSVDRLRAEFADHLAELGRHEW